MGNLHCVMFVFAFIGLVMWPGSGCSGTLENGGILDGGGDDDDDDNADDDTEQDDDASDDDTTLTDVDGDGWTIDEGDCDDNDSETYPGAQETCDGDDEDCDGLIDEEDASGCQTYHADTDGDGYGDPSDSACLCAATPPHTTTDNTDCYDGNADANPAQASFFATERGDGSFDYNCDGTETLHWMDQLSCTQMTCNLIHQGWESSIPSCGTDDSWGTECTGYYYCNAVTQPMQQECQ